MHLQTPEPQPIARMTGLPQTLPLFSVSEGGVDTFVIHLSNTGPIDLTFTFSDTMSWLEFALAPDAQ